MKPLAIVVISVAMLGGCANQTPPPEVNAAPPSPPAATAAAAPATPPPAPAKPASAEKLVIDFPPDSSELSGDATAKLDQAGRLYRDANPVQMLVAGHSDPSGSEVGNLLLSARRAAVVKQALVDRGIPAERLQIVAYGQTPLPPGSTPERDAVITWR